MSITLLGVFAGLLTSGSFIPQAYKVIKTKRTQDISLPMYSLCTIGVFVWIIYGLMINDLAVLNKYRYFCTDINHSHPYP